jgi:large subunit ribosomal protein L24
MRGLGRRRQGGTQGRRSKLHVKKGDKVVVIAGQYRSKEPREVLQVDVDANRVVVQGVNLRWKNTARSQQNPKGERVQKEAPIAASNVLLWSEKAGKGVRTRSQVVDGKRVRVGTCGTRFD